MTLICKNVEFWNQLPTQKFQPIRMNIGFGHMIKNRKLKLTMVDHGWPWLTMLFIITMVGTKSMVDHGWGAKSIAKSDQRDKSTVDHGRPWFIKKQVQQFWKSTVDHGKNLLKSTVYQVWPWLKLEPQSLLLWPWLTMVSTTVDHGWLWLTMVNHG